MINLESCAGIQENRAIHAIYPRGKIALLSFLFYFKIFVFIIGSTHADSQESRKIMFSSDPSGVTVCKKVLDREKCFGRTPLSVEVVDGDANSSQKFIFRKIGYKTRGLYVDQKMDKVSATLEKQGVFLDPVKQKDANTRDLQRSVNERLEKLIYSSDFNFEPNFDLFGEITVNKIDDRFSLNYTVLINSYNSLKELNRAGRARGQKRYASTLSVFNDAGLFPMYDEILKAISSLSLDEVAFEVMFPRSCAVLDFEQVKVYSEVYTGSHYNSYGNVTQKVDTYTTYATTKDVTAVKDEVNFIGYKFIVDRNIIRSAGMEKFSTLLDRIKICTDDTPKGKFEFIQNPAILP